MSVKELIKKILPNFILEFYYNYKIKKKKYFGHHNLDKKLLKYLDYKDGSYVELGANDGVNQSNTYFFEKNLDWKGVLVEPIEKNFLKCKKNRSIKNFFSNKACVGFNYKSDKIKIIYSDLMSSLDDKNIVQDIDPVKHTNSGKIYLRSNETVKEYYVETTTLTNILEESNLSNKIDLLSLDVEGAENPEQQLADFAASHPMNRVGEPEEVVRAVLFLASEDSSFTTGDSISVDGGVIAI